LRFKVISYPGTDHKTRVVKDLLAFARTAHEVATLGHECYGGIIAVFCAHLFVDVLIAYTYILALV